VPPRANDDIPLPTYRYEPTTSDQHDRTSQMNRQRPSGTDAMNGKVTVAELIEHGLSNHPANVAGVGFPAIDAVLVLCRSHVDASTLRRLGIGDEHSPDTAVLLIGGTNTEHALRTWCATCRATTSGTT
jgi:hypothetical protein